MSILLLQSVTVYIYFVYATTIQSLSLDCSIFPPPGCEWRRNGNTKIINNKIIRCIITIRAVRCGRCVGEYIALNTRSRIRACGSVCTHHYEFRLGSARTELAVLTEICSRLLTSPKHDHAIVGHSAKIKYQINFTPDEIAFRARPNVIFACVCVCVSKCAGICV